MAFKFDRQHMTGQQQAIAAQRDAADELSRKESKKRTDESYKLELDIIALLKQEGTALTCQEIRNKIKGTTDAEILAAIKIIGPKVIEVEITPLDGKANNSRGYKII
jgi:hypothetical protein